MRILVIAGTNFELYYLSSLVYLLRSRDNFLEFSLLLRSAYKDNITPEIKSLYSEIELFEIPPLTFPLSKNPIRMILNFFDNLYQTIKFRNYIKKKLAKTDILFISCFREFFANMICKAAPQRVRLVALRMADQKLDEDSEYKKKPFLSFLLNIKNFIFGYSTMEYRWSKTKKNALVAKQYKKYPYHLTISITDYDIGRQDPRNYRLPPPFSALKQLYRLEDNKPAILVAGDKTPLYHGWDTEDQEKYEQFLDYLRSDFKNYILYFKPKAGKTDPGKFNLEGFSLIEPEESMEEICLRKNITKVISIVSTASKVGTYFGASGYLLYPLFKTPPELKETIENYFDDLKTVIRVRELRDLKKESDLFIKKYNFDKLASLYWEAIMENLIIK